MLVEGDVPDLVGQGVADPPAWSTFGLVSIDQGRYAVTAMGAKLRVGHPSGLRHLALMQTELPSLTAWRHAAGTHGACLRATAGTSTSKSPRT
ncbi:MAG: hypothetical protein ABI662_10685 [Dermatophilaceae bacterium]